MRHHAGFLRALRRVSTATALLWSTSCTTTEPVPEGPPEGSTPPLQSVLSGNGHEGELFGDLYSNGVKIPGQGTLYTVVLTPLGSTVEVVSALGVRWDPTFVVGSNTSGGDRSWEWFDVLDNECQSTTAELHYPSPVTPYERHCVPPGKYQLEVRGTGGAAIRSFAIDYMGGKRDSLGTLRAGQPFVTQQDYQGIANDGFVQGFYPWGIERYDTGDLLYDVDVAPPPGVSEAPASVVIENVGRSPDDTLHVPLTGNVFGPEDYVRVDPSSTPGSSPYTALQRLVRIWLQDGAGTRPITNFYWSSGGWEHLRSFSIATSSGCPQYGVETLLPFESPAINPMGQVAWKQLAVVGRCITAALPNPIPAFTTIPSSLPIGVPTAVAFTVSNASASPLSITTTWRIYLSGDGVLDRADILVATGTLGTLGSNGSQNVQTTITAPAGSGTNARIAVTLDAHRQVEEADEADNILLTSSIPIPTPVDLVPQSLGASGSLRLGTTVMINYNTVNLGGTSASGAWTEGIHLSTDNVFSPATDPRGGGTTNSATIAGPGSAARSVPFTVPATGQVGSNRLFVNIDEADIIPESSNANHASNNVTVEYATGKDLASVELKATQNGDQLNNFRYSIRNIGTTVVSCFSIRYRYYLSTDQVVSPNDYSTLSIAIANCPTSSGLTRTSTLGPPLWSFNNSSQQSPTTGTYFLIAVIDSEGSLVESNENNNAIVAATQIVVP